MNAHFEKAFEKFDECMSHMGKAIESVFDDISNKSGSKIRVKKGSRVYLGKGVYATLLSDVDAEVSNGPETEPPQEEKDNS